MLGRINMDEDNYFKIFDQYLGTPKLVPKLYKQVKKDFSNLNDAIKFSHNNSFCDDLYDDYDDYGEHDYEDKKLVDRYFIKNDVNYLKQDVLYNAFKTIESCLNHKSRYGLIKKSDIDKSKIIQSYKTPFLDIILEQRNFSNKEGWYHFNKYIKPRLWAMLILYMIAYIIKPFSYLFILFKNKRLPIKGEPFDFRDYEDIWFGYYDQYSDSIPKEMISNPKLAYKLYDKIIKRYRRNLEDPTPEKINQEWLQEFKKKS